MKNKEKHWVSVTGALLSILLALTLFGFINSLIINFTFVNPLYWRSNFFTEEVRDAMKEQGKFSIDNLTMDFDFETDYEILSDEANDILADRTMDEFFEMLATDNAEFDDEWLDNFFEEYCSGPLKESGLSDAEIEVFEESFARELNMSLEKMADKVEESGLLNKINKANDITETVMWVTMAIAVISVCVMIAIFRNKHLALNKIAMSIMVCGILSSLLWGLIRIIFSSAKASEDGKWGNLLLDEVRGTMSIIVWLFIGMVVLSLVCAVLTFRAAKIADFNLEDCYDGEEEDE